MNKNQNKTKKYLGRIWSFLLHNNAVIVALGLAIFAGVIFALAAGDNGNNELGIMNYELGIWSEIAEQINNGGKGNNELGIMNQEIPENGIELIDLQNAKEKYGELNPNTSWLGAFLDDNPEYASLPVVKADRNSVHFQKPDGMIEANFSAGPINYKDSDGVWKPIDTTLKQNGNELAGSGTPAKIKTDGTVAINNSKYSQKTISFGWLNPGSGSFESVQQLPEGKVVEDKFIRETPQYKHVLTILDNGLKEELTLYEIPNGGHEGSWLVLETEITGIDLPDGWLDKEFKIGDNTFPLPTTKDAQGSEAPTKRFAQKINNIQYLYTGIPVSWLATAQYPVTLDPDFAGSTADGIVRGYDATYATARSTSYSSPSTNITLPVGQFTGYQVYRGFLKFDTSAIGAGSTVTQVNLKLVCTTDYSTTDFDIQIVKQNWSAQDPLSSGNQETAYDNCLAGDLDDNIWRNTLNMNINQQYASPNLAVAWVNKVGDTYYSLRSNRDLAGTTPTGNEVIDIASANHATAAYRPVLTVEYTAGAGDTPVIFRPGAVFKNNVIFK